MRSTVFDGDNRQTSTTDLAGEATAYTYDADGNQTAAGATTFTYDAFGTQTVNALTSTAPVQPFGYTGALTKPALTGKSGAWGTFFDTYVPVRPDYRLYHIADLLRQEGCPQLAGQIAIDGISGLTGWERDAAAVDAAAADNSATAPAAGSNPAIALLGKYQDIKDYIAAGPPGAFDADFLNFQGNAKKGTAGVGSWNWTRNKRYIDDALTASKEVRLVTDPNTHIYEKGNVYQRELKYLKDNGYGWVPVDDHWVVVGVRP
ncbi:YD repeat-containing protein [Catenulispora sp. EB89]|uniref:RHS repeat domain-containing protein n=1 Tax=Catenulispora sp. EB89 TaxID=3156257 RepID=UPI0035147599